MYRGKRLFDVLAAALGLLLLAPLLAAAALAIRLSSAGPVLFRQQRVGRDFKPFCIYKFRTMVADAADRGGPLTRGGHDPRITPLGRLLRKTKFDELPQLINVLRGEMSLVGPRPEVPRYVEMFRDEFRHLLAVRPGITDPASVRFRSEAELLGAAADAESLYVREILPEKIRLSRQYIRQASLCGDLRILWQTLAGS